MLPVKVHSRIEFEIRYKSQGLVNPYLPLLLLLASRGNLLPYTPLADNLHTKILPARQLNLQPAILFLYAKSFLVLCRGCFLRRPEHLGHN